MHSRTFGEEASVLVRLDVAVGIKSMGRRRDVVWASTSRSTSTRRGGQKRSAKKRRLDVAVGILWVVGAMLFGRVRRSTSTRRGGHVGKILKSMGSSARCCLGEYE